MHELIPLWVESGHSAAYSPVSEVVRAEKLGSLVGEDEGTSPETFTSQKVVWQRQPQRYLPRTGPPFLSSII
jgi:hypothetical protein